jgi:glyoxylase-like metal-dependent hydrolase (beta-lactamase superfamily II)
LRDGRWVPTFPNATYIFSEKEVAAWRHVPEEVPTEHMTDSVLPVIAAGQAKLVSNDFALDDEVWLEPSLGRTPDHMSVCLASQGARAVITGDLIHSPVQCLEPQWMMRADFDPEQAKATRRSFLEKYCETDVLVCATHFPASSTGHLIRLMMPFGFSTKIPRVGKICGLRRHRSLAMSKLLGSQRFTKLALSCPAFWFSHLFHPAYERPYSWI